MIKPHFLTPLVIVVAIISASALVAQTTEEDARNRLGERGSGTNGVGISAVPPKVVTTVVRRVAVTPVRAWQNAEGKTINARLLAFSAPEEGETGPVEVIREGKVRFLLTGKPQPVDYPLAQLIQPDQDEIQRIAKAAAATPEATGEKPEKSGTTAPVAE